MGQMVFILFRKFLLPAALVNPSLEMLPLGTKLACGTQRRLVLNLALYGGFQKNGRLLPVFVSLEILQFCGAAAFGTRVQLAGDFEGGLRLLASGGSREGTPFYILSR